MRTGIGYDLHRISPTSHLSSIRIGGIDIPCPFQIEAHSDGDVLLHALVDALLGALALGDIGDWFSDKAAENRGRKSDEFVDIVLTEVKKLGFRVTHFDSILLLEEPKLGAHKLAIKENLARLLEIDSSQVSVKAKTMEGLGPIGERRAVAAHAVINLEKSR